MFFFFPCPADITHVLPEFPVLNPESVHLQEGIESRDLQALQLFYRRHCEVILTPSPPSRKGPGLKGTCLGALPRLLHCWGNRVATTGAPLPVPLEADLMGGVCPFRPTSKW